VEKVFTFDSESRHSQEQFESEIGAISEIEFEI